MALRKSHTSSASSLETTNAAKTLLANIGFLHVDDPIGSIVITSSIPNEGKSFVAQKLSEAIATSGKSVLLMEADLRRRSLASRIGIHVSYGLYSVLSGAVPVSEAAVATHTANMYFLDAEPNIPNPSDVFGSKRFSHLIEKLAQSYDYLVIDTPPVGAFVDAAILSRISDATLLVVRENFTKKDQIKDAYEQLKRAGGNLSGVVMNYCKHEGSQYYSSYYSKQKDKGSAPSYESAASKAAPYKAHPSHVQRRQQQPPLQQQPTYRAPTGSHNPYLDPRS